MKDELLGLKEVETVALNCGDCGFPLIEIVLTETNDDRLRRGLYPMKNRFQVVDCPKCGGKSFNSKILEGTTIIGAAKNGYEFECIGADIDDENTIYNVLRIEKTQ